MNLETRDAIDAAHNVPALVKAVREAVVHSTDETDFGYEWECELDAIALRCIERARGLP